MTPLASVFHLMPVILICGLSQSVWTVSKNVDWPISGGVWPIKCCIRPISRNFWPIKPAFRPVSRYFQPVKPALADKSQLSADNTCILAGKSQLSVDQALPSANRTLHFAKTLHPDILYPRYFIRYNTQYSPIPIIPPTASSTTSSINPERPG